MIIKRPIYDKNLKTVAFEILSSDPFSDIDNENISKLESLIDPNMPNLPFLVPYELKGYLETSSLPKEHPIILMLKAKDVDTKFSLETLTKAPYSIALIIEDMKQLVWINLADYLAVTEQVVSSSNAEKIVQFAKLHNRKVIAYNIEIPLNFEVCKTLIIDFYCGDFVFRPTATADHKIPANKLHLMHLIKHVQAKEIDLIEVAKIIKNDALLSFQLLKIANSAAFIGGVELNSIDQSILRLGTNQLKHWAMTLSMRQISDKPIEVLESGLIRAYMAQTIATQFSEVNPQTAYTAGLLSILDCVLNKSMEEIAREIGLSPEMTKALSQFEGPTGQLLSTVIAYETGNWQNMPQQDIDALDLSRIYIESLSHIQNEYQWLH